MATELSRVLAEHAGRYPLMRPCDGVKLVYQSELGGGHLIRDPAASLDRLRAEWSGVAPDPSAPLAEDIGNGMVRVMLAAVREDELETLNDDFVRSARRHTGDWVVFRQKLEELRELARQGALPFSPEELEDYLADYVKADCPPASHSPEYRAACRPAYRVVERSASMLLLLRELKALRDRGGRAVVAIDGRCASGKTTLAAELQARYGFAVVHMDHFFLCPEQRTMERYAQPGGNVDYERVLSEVLEPLRRGEWPEYRPFDCHTGTLAAPVQLEPSPVVVVEGSYACCPALWEHYDLRVFLTVEEGEQLRRLTAREGDYVRAFRERWIPLEERYFSACRVEERCGWVLDW